MHRSGSRLRQRTTRLVAAVAALWSLIPMADAALTWDTSPLAAKAVTAQHHLCGTDDLPELGIQGDVPKAAQDSGRAQQGYNCGLALLGHTSLATADGRPDANANMAWAGHCAYVASSAGM